MDKTWKDEDVANLKVVEIALVQYYLVDNQYQQTFAPNNSYAYLLNFKISRLVLLKTQTAGFDDIDITFTV